MNKYLFLAACILSQGINAQVELNVVLNGQNQTVLLDENQQEACTFDELRIIIRDIEEDEGSVMLELTINEDTTGQVAVEFGKSVVINLQTNNLEISASRK